MPGQSSTLPRLPPSPRTVMVALGCRLTVLLSIIGSVLQSDYILEYATWLRHQHSLHRKSLTPPLQAKISSASVPTAHQQDFCHPSPTQQCLSCSFYTSAISLIILSLSLALSPFVHCSLGSFDPAVSVRNTET